MVDQPDERDRRISTDRETIRGWAEETNAVPVRHTETEGDRQRLLLVEESDVGGSHDRLDWDEFFTEMEEHDQVLIYRGAVEREPFEVVARDEAVTRSTVDQEQLEEELVEGKTVTSEVTETTVVESVIVEEATIESELVDTEIVDQQMIDAELLDRECTACEVVEDHAGDDAELFDENRYLRSLDTGGQLGGEADARGSEGGRGSENSFPYHAELDVLETWTVTWELLERFTVESRITETDLSGTETVAEQDIDFEGVHRDILESDLLGGDLSADEILTEYDVESEFTEGDTVRSYFKRRRVIEDEVADGKRLRADITGGETFEMETVSSRDIETTFTDDEELTPLDSAPPDAEGSVDATIADADRPTDGTTGDTEQPVDATTTERTSVTITEDEIGKTVVDARGEEIGMVTDVDESGTRLYVDADPGIAERIKAELDWGDTDEDDSPVPVEKIERITDDRVELSTVSDETP